MVKKSGIALFISAALVLAGAQSMASNPAPNSQTDGIPPCADLTNQIEILSETNGVDFCSYIRESVLAPIRSTWINLMPEEVYSPTFKQGHAKVDFFIYQDGKVRDLRLEATSGDVALDRAAWAAVAASSPLEPLPFQFKGRNLGLRIHFYYNSGPGSDSPARNGAYRAGGPVIAPVLVRSKMARYPKSARKSGSEGTVWLSVIVGANGKPGDAMIVKSVSPELDAEAIKTVGKWRFRPGTLAGKPVAVEVSEEVVFKLN